MTIVGQPSKMRPFDIELNLPKPEVSRPRIDETYGMLQLGLRFLTLLADLGGIGVFVYVGVVWGYVNHFATAAVSYLSFLSSLRPLLLFSRILSTMELLPLPNALGTSYS